MGKIKSTLKGMATIAILVILFMNLTKDMGAAKTSSLIFNDTNMDKDVSVISSKLVRFHVIANSDSKEDQEVKLKVRDAILKGLGNSLEKCKTRAESLEFLRSKSKSIEKMADDILSENGKSYSSKAIIGEFEFPIKSYGKITLPPGKYTALRVVLGDGDGKNWWCVMFPPLCFIDITRGLTNAETDKSLGKVLNQKELAKVTKAKALNSVILKNKKPAKQNVKFKLKSVEMVKSLFK